MIEDYFQKGAILTGYDFKDTRGAPLAEVSSGVMDGNMTITKTKIVSIYWGLSSKIEKTVNVVNFRLLPYAQGAINYCELMGRDVISAYFSGCIMARYKRDGAWRVCHVSTGDPNDCKDKWEQIKAEDGVTDVSEFKPHENVDGGDKILGLVTSTGDCFAIGCSAVDVDVPETRSVEQILIDEAASFRKELTKEERLGLAKAMAATVKKVKGLEIKSCNAIHF